MASAPLPVTRWHAFRSQVDYVSYLEEHRDLLAGQRAHEAGWITGDPVTIEGFCYPCHRPSAFAVDYQYAYPVSGILTPNWRESLRCSACGLNNRMRASIEGFQQLLQPVAASRILLGEQITPLARWLLVAYHDVVGCEYLEDTVPLGETDERGVRNEDFTKLTFPALRFDFVLSFDVLEHIPDFRRALSESYRVLKPGGRLMFSAPFRSDLPQHLIRARVDPQGTVVHLLPAEYHGGPLNTAGCLAFYHFGWELLDDLRRVGFSDPRLYMYWDAERGYLGADQFFVVAERPSA